MHALRDATIRRVLDSCVFEPGRHLSPEFEGKVPTTVPADSNDYLATAFGIDQIQKSIF